MKRSTILSATRAGQLSKARNARGIARGIARQGFTLVELLVVITIIGVLASMITVGVFAALKYANRAAIYAEINGMNGGAIAFKDQFQAYPPDGSGGRDKVTRFIKKAFPSARSNVVPPGELLDAKSGPVCALVFWLSEVDKDPRNPFKQGNAGFGGTAQKDAKYNLFSFDESRIKQRRYYAKGFDIGTDPPYVYFCNETYQNATYQTPEGQAFKPYDRGQSTSQSGRSGGNGRDYAAADTCQIICAGLNKKLGSGGTMNVESAQGTSAMSADDEDNIVNFDTRAVGDIR